MPSGKPDATVVGAVSLGQVRTFKAGDTLDVKAFNHELPTYTFRRDMTYNHIVLFRDNQTGELSWCPANMPRRNGLYRPIFGLSIPRQGLWRERIENALNERKCTLTMDR